MPVSSRNQAPAPGSTEQAPATAVNVSAAEQTTAELDNFHFDQGDEALIEQICRFPRGSLFDLHSSQDTTTRCRLAAIIGHHERFIFINRNGLKVAEMSMPELLQALKTEQLVAIEQSMVFDQALETVVSGLRRNADDPAAGG